jgi:hypothetical protein
VSEPNRAASAYLQMLPQRCEAVAITVERTCFAAISLICEPRQFLNVLNAPIAGSTFSVWIVALALRISHIYPQPLAAKS